MNYLPEWPPFLLRESDARLYFQETRGHPCPRVKAQLRQRTKFHTLRSLRCRSSSRARPLRHEDRARQGKNDVHFACQARVAPGTF